MKTKQNTMAWLPGVLLLAAILAMARPETSAAAGT